MNLVSWNCRGLGGPRKQQFLTRLLRSTRANIAFIVETKCSLPKSNQLFQNDQFLPNFVCVPARGQSGGMWLMWDHSVNVQVISQTRHLIHARIQQPHQPSWSLVCVYGDLAHAMNMRIWDTIKQIIESEAEVCVVGDFNAITGIDEKYGGNPVLNMNSCNFRDFLFETGLVDLGFKGSAYTWTNRQSTSNAIFECLDRVVATVQWSQLYPQAFVNHLPRIHSDHAPILLRTQGKQHNQ